MTEHLDLPAPQVRERIARGVSGWPVLTLAILMVLLGVVTFIIGVQQEDVTVVMSLIGVSILFELAALVAWAGLTAVAPGEARVVQLLGRYTGTVRTDGLRWVNPFTTRRKVSTRIRNHETDVLKVNDADGNPIEIAAVVVWQVEDTAQAPSSRSTTSSSSSPSRPRPPSGTSPTATPTTPTTTAQMSLRDNADEITARLSEEIGVRVAAAGVKIIESRLTRLAYAPEIAHAMLRRQQANAIVAARTRSSKARWAWSRWHWSGSPRTQSSTSTRNARPRWSATCSWSCAATSDAQPVVNTGTLYQ